MATERKRTDLKLKAYLAKLEIAQKATDVNPFETKAEQLARINRAKTDWAYLVKTYFPHYATAECADFQLSEAQYIYEHTTLVDFLEWFRGAAKSVWADIIIPIGLWIRDEDVFMCLMSDSKERAEELLADLQAELEGNALLIHDFGVQKCEGDWEIGNFKTIDQRFIGMAFGAKQKVRGIRVKQRRPNLWIIDDLETPDTISNPKRMRKQAERIEREVIPTMTGKIRRVLYACNRFARVMTQTILQEKHPEFRVNQVKAYDKTTHEPRWKSMYTAEYYKEQEKAMGIVAAYAEYLHESKLDGAIFSEEQIQWGKLPPLNEFKIILAHWDIAYTDNEKSDYNALKIWGLHSNDFWLIDCYVKQSKMKDAVRWLCHFEKKLKSGLAANMDVLFLKQYESQFWNGEVQRAIDEVENEEGLNLNLMKHDTPRTNKFFRIVSMQPYYQNSRIYYNEALKSHSDTQLGIMQLCSVEEGSTEHDDSPDADQQAIATLEKYTTSSRKTTGPCWMAGKVDNPFPAI